MKRLCFVVLFLLAATALLAQSTQNERTWDLHSGIWNMWAAQDTSATLDSVLVTTDADGDTFITRYFLMYPISGAHIFIEDTSSVTDSVKLVIRLRQDGFGYEPDSTRSILTKTLRWKSTTSSTLSDTLTAAGYYAANFIDSAIFPFRFSWLEIITFVGHKIDNGIFIHPVVNGYNN